MPAGMARTPAANSRTRRHSAGRTISLRPAAIATSHHSEPPRGNRLGGVLSLLAGPHGEGPITRSPGDRALRQLLGYLARRRAMRRSLKSMLAPDARPRRTTAMVRTT